MKICINIFGSQRDVNNTVDLVNNYIIENENEYYILYTGWENEPQIYETLFENIYIKRFALDKQAIKEYCHKYSQYKVHDGYVPPKTLEYILEGLYIKQKSMVTIQSFMIDNNIQFDLIITVRSDTKLTDKLSNYYSEIIQHGLDKIYIANGPNWNIFNKGAASDLICISNYENTIKMLDQIRNFDKCIAEETNNTFHPETSYYRYLRWCNDSVIRLNFEAPRSYQGFHKPEPF